MPTPYKGKFSKLKNPQKYSGDVSKIIYRSSWEREAFRWCDENPEVEEWASEEFFIPYFNPIAGRKAKYYPDLFIKMASGQCRIIEIKPKKQTQKPAQSSRKSQKYINEVATYTINQTKWEAAVELAEKNNMTFEIWTEDELKKMGLLKTLNRSEMSRESTSKKPTKRVINKRTVARPKRKS